MSSEETPNSFSNLRVLKVDVRTDHTGVNVVMQFIDDSGYIFITPSIPYPDNYDPMRIEHADHNGDEIRIKNADGDILLSIHADSINYDSGINTSINPSGSVCINRNENEEPAVSVRQGLDWGSAMTQAFGEANTARQGVDATIQQELNALEPEDLGRPTMGASAWFREQQLTGGAYQYPATSDSYDYEHPHVIEPPQPKIKIDFDMKCTCCEGKIHYPDKLIQLLGEEGTIKYFKFCKKTKTEPQMFCCACFGLMSNNSNIITAINKMNNKIKDMMDLTEREEEVTKREKELDEHLKKKDKKRFWEK